MNLQLPFEYELLAMNKDGEDITVLVKKKGDREEFVTYKVDNKGSCYWGNYIEKEETARKNFALRANFSTYEEMVQS